MSEIEQIEDDIVDDEYAVDDDEKNEEIDGSPDDIDLPQPHREQRDEL